MSEKQTDNLQVLVFGMGAIGTYVGGSLARAGHHVTFIEKPEIGAKIDRRNITLKIKGQKLQVPEIELCTSVADVISRNAYDIGILAVKSFDTSAVVESMWKNVTDMPPILDLQNGVENEARLAEGLGSEKVIAGTVTTAIGRAGAGQIVVEKQRGIGIALGHPLSGQLVTAFNQAGLHARGYSEAQGMKWSKMLTNLLANASSAILDYPPAVIFAHPGLFEIEMKMVKEALAVMRALNIPVIDLPGTPVRALVWIIQNLPAGVSRPLLYQALGKGRGGKMPSFHIDLYAGRQNSEVDFLNGAVVRFGEQVHLPTPINAWMTHVLIQMANGSLPKEALAHQPEKFIEWVKQGRLHEIAADDMVVI